MFAYCNNNPTNLSDNSGELPRYAFLGDNHIFSDKILTSGGGGGIPCTSRAASAQVIDNEITYIQDTFLTPAGISTYNGTLVIRHSNSFLTSWAVGGIIFLNRNSDNETTLAHEYGHILRERKYGSAKYLASVFAPSALYNLASRFSPALNANYYNMPWEYDAEVNGNVSRNYDYAAWTAVARWVYFTIWGGV